MKQTLFAAGLSTLLVTGTLIADPLKSSLMSAGQKDTPMVNLDNLNVAKKPVKKQKSRPDDTIVASINGKNVTKEQADEYLAARSQGKAIDFDKLPKQQRQALINEMSIPFLAAIKAHKELNDEEKNAALSRMWMQKKIATTEVSDKEAKAAYDQLIKSAKEAAKKSKKEAKLPKFEQAKQRIKLQIAQDKVLEALVKEGKVVLK
ncbi:MAG: hypothetical protein ABXS92_07200 [Sulfurimonas sp.]